MSTGQQLISALIDQFGNIISSLIGAVFAAFVTPLFEAIAAAFGL